MMTVVSVKTFEELKLTWLSQIICIFHSLNYDVNISLLQRRIQILCLDEKLLKKLKKTVATR